MAKKDAFPSLDSKRGICSNETETLEEQRKRNKWENDDYVCHGHILNGMPDSLFDIYQYVDSAKELWNQLKSKYISEYMSSKKFLVSNFNNYKMIDPRPVIEQFHEIQRILGSFKQHNIAIDETFIVSSIIDKLPPNWKDVRNSLKHNKDYMNVKQLVAHLWIKEGIRLQDGQKDSNHPNSSIVNMVEDGKTKTIPNNKKRPHNFYKGKMNKRPKFVKENQQANYWECGKLDHLKRDCTIWKRKMVKASLAKANRKKTDDSWWIDSGASRHVCKDRCLFKTFKEDDNGEVLYMVNDSMAKNPRCWTSRIIT
ncbi:hypothetical protein V8G54_031321 [Vigna mungo]|uniref:Retrovirus-related Pol polyprotein from transposon TNT 1-94-like beta-barrel domain-containing protein n=1 Tax=Vigna mungo TaxID=3915 RepID=A0AAQ3MXX4_VIGMU